MKGLTNATLSSMNGSGKLLYAINNTGKDIVSGQKVWLNQHNNIDLTSSWLSGGYADFIGGFSFFFNADSNFLAVKCVNSVSKFTYNVDEKTWLSSKLSPVPKQLTNLVAYNNYLSDEKRYYGFYISTSDFSNMASVTIDGNLAVVNTFDGEIVLSEQWALKPTETSYVYNLVDRINTGRDAIELDYSEFKENICSIMYEPDGKFFILTQGYSDKIIRSRQIEISWRLSEWVIVSHLEKNPREENNVTQPMIKYYTGLENGDYLITTATVSVNSWEKMYELIIYQIAEDGLTVPNDLPAELQALVGQPCVVRYDKRLQRLYISNATDFYMFEFDGEKFVLDTLSFDKSSLPEPNTGGYSFGVSDDKTTIAIQAQTSSSSGKFQILKLVNADDSEWYAENYTQVCSYSLSGYATGKVDEKGRYEVRTVLPEEVTYTVTFTPDVERFELIGGAQ